MGNLPPEYEAIMQQIEAYRIAHGDSKPPNEVLKQIYKQLIQMIESSGSEADPGVLYYTGANLMKVYARAMALLNTYPPTHRKGVGKDGGKLSIPQEPWMWYFDGTESAGGSEAPPGEGELPPDIDAGVFDWAPASEESRAKAMLHQIADEMNFGPGDDPFEFVKAVAQALGGRWGLNGKRGNANTPSKDILAWQIPGHAPQLFDVIGDAGGRNSITWQHSPYTFAAVWLDPFTLKPTGQ